MSTNYMYFGLSKAEMLKISLACSEGK